MMKFKNNKKKNIKSPYKIKSIPAIKIKLNEKIEKKNDNEKKKSHFN